MSALLDLDNDGGENLHICADRSVLWIGASDGTAGGSYEASRQDVVKLVVTLEKWLRWEADQL